MKLIKAKVKLKKGRLKAEVKYPLVGGAELELGPESKLKAVVKAPFVFFAKLAAFFKFKKKKNDT